MKRFLSFATLCGLIALIAIPLAAYPQGKQDKNPPRAEKPAPPKPEQGKSDPDAKERIDKLRSRQSERDKQVDKILNKQKKDGR